MISSRAAAVRRSASFSVDAPGKSRRSRKQPRCLSMASMWGFSSRISIDATRSFCMLELRSRGRPGIRLPPLGQGCQRTKFDGSHKVHNQTVGAVVNCYDAPEIGGENVFNYLRSEPSPSRRRNPRANLLLPVEYY